MNGVRATHESKRGRERERSVLDFPFYSALKREFVPTVRVRADRKAGAGQGTARRTQKKNARDRPFCSVVKHLVLFRREELRFHMRHGWRAFFSDVSSGDLAAFAGLEMGTRRQPGELFRILQCPWCDCIASPPLTGQLIDMWDRTIPLTWKNFGCWNFGGLRGVVDLRMEVRKRLAFSHDLPALAEFTCFDCEGYGSA